MDVHAIPPSKRERSLPPDRLPCALRALVLLWRRGRFDLAAQGEAWPLGVTDGALRDAGIASEELNWLLDVSYVGCVSDVDANRISTLRPSNALSLDGKLYVITEAGAAFLEQVSKAVSPTANEILQRSPIGQAIDIPRYNSDRRELTYRGVLVKRFRKAAPNQESVLDTFERLGWPKCIGNPFPFDIHMSPVDRLHDAIKRLNLTLTAPLLHFGGDGKGAGACWRATTPPLPDDF